MTEIIIEEFEPQVLESAGGETPTIITKERALAVCGCCVFVGIRLDNHEVAVVSAACVQEHMPMMTHFQMLMQLSTADPQDRLAVEVAADLLQKTVDFYAE